MEEGAVAKDVAAAQRGCRAARGVERSSGAALFPPLRPWVSSSKQRNLIIHEALKLEQQFSKYDPGNTEGSNKVKTIFLIIHLIFFLSHVHALTSISRGFPEDA